ncbi:MAG: hypothetical protein WA933_00085, partial [Microcoleaceae cyanobacterium]
DKLLEELLEYLSTLSIFVEFKAKGYARIQVSTSLFNYDIEFDICKGFTYNFQLLDWTRVRASYNFENGLITFHPEINDKVFGNGWVGLKFYIPATPVPPMMKKQCDEEEEEEEEQACHFCNGKLYRTIEDMIENCIKKEDDEYTVWSAERGLSSVRKRVYHDHKGPHKEISEVFTHNGMVSGVGRRNGTGSMSAKWKFKGAEKKWVYKFFRKRDFFDITSCKWKQVYGELKKDYERVEYTFAPRENFSYSRGQYSNGDAERFAQTIRSVTNHYLSERPAEVASKQKLYDFPSRYNSFYDCTEPAYTAGYIYSEKYTINWYVVSYSFAKEIEYQNDCSEPKIEDVPMEDKNCCSMIRQILDRLGGDDFEAILPKSLTDGKDSIERIKTVPEMIAKTIEYQDELAGSYPVEIDIQDSDLTKEGDQTISLEFPNQAEFLAEMYGMMYEIMKNLTVTQELAFKAMTIGGLNQQALIKTRAQIETIQDYLDFNIDEVEKKYPWLFTPGEQDWDKILEEVEYPVKTQQYDTTEQTLKAQLIELMQGTAILRARYFRRVGDKFDFMELLKKGASLGSDFLEGEGKDEKWDKWKDFIEDELMKRHDEPSVRPDIKEIRTDDNN